MKQRFVISSCRTVFTKISRVILSLLFLVLLRIFIVTVKRPRHSSQSDRVKGSFRFDKSLLAAKRFSSFPTIRPVLVSSKGSITNNKASLTLRFIARNTPFSSKHHHILSKILTFSIIQCEENRQKHTHNRYNVQNVAFSFALILFSHDLTTTP